MSSEGAVGFWSYAHEDNNLDGGAILELARLIKEEYNLLSGESLEIFIDQDSLAWGQEWRARIDSSLMQTTFFIPIITPRYFTRPECRRELFEFVAKTKSLGVEELLLPILYVETPGLSAESLDEAVALVGRTQYVDWHLNRLLEPSSREYRTAINALARRLLEIARNVTEVQLNRELNVDTENDGIDGIADIVERISVLLPDWLDAVLGEETNAAQVSATWEQYESQMVKLRKANAPSSAILGAQIRLSREMIPLVERGLKQARIYLARSIELDPFVSALARLTSEDPGSFALAASVRDAIDEAMTGIAQNKLSDPRYASVNKKVSQMKRLSRVFQKMDFILNERTQAVDEANAIVIRWDAEMRIQDSEGLQ